MERNTFLCQVEPELVEENDSNYALKARPVQERNDLFEVIQKSNSSRLRWLIKPKRFLIIHKLNDKQVMDAFYQLIQWIVDEDLGDVYVEERTFKELYPKCTNHKNLLHSFQPSRDDLTGKIDLVMCLGGDGTLLYASSLFQTQVPPVMAFNLGTLGFLTPFRFSNFRNVIPSVFHGEPSVLQRMRLTCIIHTQHGSNITKQSLNEVVIDRGSMPFLSNLDVAINGHYVTTVAGDGLIISSPTGSTAYSMAVGASMIHPQVSCMLLAPISPHSLSFRPIVLPLHGVEICITVNSRTPTRSWGDVSAPLNNTTWGHNVSVDGRSLCSLDKSGSVTIRASGYPVPTLCESGEVFNWFCGLAKILHWNARTTNAPDQPQICPASPK